MRPARWGLALAVAGLAACGDASAQQGMPRAELRRELEAATAAMERDFARGDMLAVARAYADDAQMIPPSGHEPIRGRAALDRFWRKLEHPRSWRMETLDWGGARDEAWQLVRSTMVEGTEASPRPAVVRCLLVWRRESGGAWRIHLDMWTNEERSWHASH